MLFEWSGGESQDFHHITVMLEDRELGPNKSRKKLKKKKQLLF